MAKIIKCLRCNADVMIDISEDQATMSIFCINEICDNHFPTRHIDSIKTLLEHFYIYDDGKDDYGE